MFLLFLARKEWAGGRGGRGERNMPDPYTLAPRQYEILHLVVIQSWTHLAFYGRNSGGVEIFTRRITKFRKASAGCEVRRILGQRCTRSSLRSLSWSGYWVLPAGAALKLYSVYFFAHSHALLLFTTVPRGRRDSPRAKSIVSISGISHQTLPLQPWPRNEFCALWPASFVPSKRIEPSISIRPLKKLQENIERSLLCSTIAFILKLFNAIRLTQKSDVESLHQKRATKLSVYSRNF